MGFDGLPNKPEIQEIGMNRFFLAALLTMSSLSYAGTGFKTGEQISGFNKICYYDGASGAFSKTVSSISLCPLSADDGKGQGGGSNYGSNNSTFGNSSQLNQMSNRGQLSGERSSGLNKTCYYDSIKGTFTKTVSSVSLCPLSATQ